jgi:outer membrane protein OmpA-like peptidoglycan-associated protein
MGDFVPEVRAGSRGFGGLAIAVLVLPLFLAGCSAVPDWADPTEWFEDDGPSPQPVATAEEPVETPSLSSVPEQPREISSAEERAKDVQALQAEQSAARYSEETLNAPPLVTSAGPETSSASVARASVGSAGVAAARPLASSGGASPTAPRASAFTPLRLENHEVAAVVYFAHSSTVLDRDDLAVLVGVVSIQRQRRVRLKIVGHASSRTAVASAAEHQIANFSVSFARAERVRRALVQLGVPASDITTEAVGDRQPVYHEFMPTGEAGNRRVEVYFVY